MVSLLSLIGAVGILSATIYLVSSQTSNVNLNIKASTNKTLNGEIVSDDPVGCKKNFYLGCYKLMTDTGEKFDLVEDTNSLNFDPYIGQSVQVIGRQAEVRGKNVLMVSSVTSR